VTALILSLTALAAAWLTVPPNEPDSELHCRPARLIGLDDAQRPIGGDRQVDDRSET